MPVKWTMRPLQSGLPDPFLDQQGQPQAIAILVSVERLDAEWSQSEHYVALDSNECKLPRFNAALKRIVEGREVYMPILSFPYNDLTGFPDVDRVQFFDGRHSCAAAREHGERSINVCVPMSQRSRFLKQFGA